MYTIVRARLYIRAHLHVANAADNIYNLSEFSNATFVALRLALRSVDANVELTLARITVRVAALHFR